MNPLIFKFIILLVIGILVGYLFGASTVPADCFDNAPPSSNSSNY